MTQPHPAPQPLDLPDDAAAETWLRERTDATLARARELVAGLKEAPPSDALDVLRAWDQVTLELGGLAGMAALLANVHPVEAVRTAGEDAEVAVDRLQTELGQDAELYAVLAGLPAEQTAALDRRAARLLTKTLQDFRRAGVDRDEATRARLVEVNARLTEVGLEFSRVIRDDVRTVRVSPDRLAGLPEDWRDAHPVGDDGLVEVTTDYPDLLPVRLFAHDAELRRELTEASLNRGWPRNDEVLREILALRHERARLVGAPDWATFDAEVKMIGSGVAEGAADGEAEPSRRIPEFIDRIAEAAAGPARRDLDTLLARRRQDDPEAAEMTTADLAYYEELVRKEQLEVDSQLVRTYFAFPRVREGLLAVTGRLFGISYQPVEVPTWHEDVTTYDVLRDAPGAPEHGARLGRIHLDLHPREGKYQHAAQFDLSPGVSGRRLAEGVLVCNFSRGLMEHDHVVTLFHEFGHLVHHVLAGQGEWARFSGVATEWDFVEAPSQLLEEWAWDPAVLRTFATDEAGEPIPVDLVERMRAADDFGKGVQARQQMFYAAVSYFFHAERPDDMTARMRELQEAYSPLAHLPGTHFFAGFDHLGGYSSAYYTYMWSLVIAKDLFSAFDAADLLAPEVAARYRDHILAPGGEKDAAELVEDFLGRPYSFDAYAAWLAS